MAITVLALSGCGQGRPSGDAPDQEAEHAGHVIPAHKPKTLPDAVRKLRELNDEIARGLEQGPPDEKRMHVALDIANWLPEIAADSDLPEKQWSEVDARSKPLVDHYQAILRGGLAERRAAAAGARLVIEDLERLLVASDPLWFGESERGMAIR